MAVRTRVIWPATTVGTGGITIFTCPAGRTAIIKAVWMYWPGPITTTVWDIFLDNAALSTVLVQKGTLAADSSFVMRDPFVLNPGNKVVMHSSGGNMLSYAWGSLLLGAPS